MFGDEFQVISSPVVDPNEGYQLRLDIQRLCDRFQCLLDSLLDPSIKFQFLLEIFHVILLKSFLLVANVFFGSGNASGLHIKGVFEG